MDEVVITRVHHVGPLRRSRNLGERLMVRFPALYRRLAALVFGLLSPRSRLRRSLLRWACLSGWASFDRRDFEVNFSYFAPDVEYEFPAEFQTLGLAGPFRGHEGRMEALERIFEVWGSTLEPVYLVDLGERVLNLGFWHTQARASGVPLKQELAQLVTVRKGLVIRDQTFSSWDDGLRAAGLEPGSIALPLPRKATEAAAQGG